MAQASTTRWVKNTTNAVVTITWNDGKDAARFNRRQSMNLAELPEGFMQLPEVIARINSGAFITYEA